MPTDQTPEKNVRPPESPMQESKQPPPTSTTTRPRDMYETEFLLVRDDH